jgi:hypothetical protein
MASALASAAAGASNPFGLPLPRTARNGQLPVDTGGPNGYQLLTPPQSARGPQNSPTQTAVLPIPSTPATTPGAAAAPTPTVNTAFDLQTDPALQLTNAFTGLSDQQANAQALQQRQQTLLQYGDPTLAAAVLGANDPTVMAAGQNQESDLSMLGRQRDQSLRSFETQLDPSLAFSGYRVGQEQQLGQAFQDALAKAAAGEQGNLGSITGNLNSALNQNAMSRANALEQAYQDELRIILNGGGTGAAGSGTAPPTPGDGSPGPSSSGQLFGPDNPIPDYFAPLNNLTPQDLANLAARAGGKIPG